MLFAAFLAPSVAAALDLPAPNKRGEMLHPGHYACLDGTTPTSEFDILDGTAYFLRGATLRAGDFAYDKATGEIVWKTGPFAGGHVRGFNTIRIADNKPVIIMMYAPEDGDPSTEQCTIVE